jgi:hypothetical protein
MPDEKDDKNATVGDYLRRLTLGDGPVMHPGPRADESEEAFFQRLKDTIREAIVDSSIGRGDDDAGELWEAIFKGPAPHATRFGIVPYYGYVRLGFGEQYQPGFPVEHRGAVTLSDYTLYELWKVLGQTDAVRAYREQEEAAKQATPGPDNADKAPE